MSLFTPIKEDPDWFCLLLNKEIEEGYCCDVNYERLGFFKPGVLREVTIEFGVRRQGVRSYQILKNIR